MLEKNELESMLRRMEVASRAARDMEVGHLLTKAYRALAELRIADARKLYRQALELDPHNQEARTVLAELTGGG